MTTNSNPLLRVMSYNLRTSVAPDGPNHWVHRKDLWASTVRAFDPDLLGVQEAMADQYDHLLEMFPDYGFVGVARGDGKREDEWAAILYRKERIERIDGGDFWLSETPNVAGSRSWDSKHVRICTWAKLEDRQSGRTLLHANTHLDNEGRAARREGAKLLRKKLPELAGGSAIILTGDFNSGEGDEPYNVLVRPEKPDGLLLSDSYREMHPQRQPHEGSLHDFSGKFEGNRIDWILHTPELVPTSAEIDRFRAPDGRFPSDHYAVTALFRWA